MRKEKTIQQKLEACEAQLAYLLSLDDSMRLVTPTGWASSVETVQAKIDTLKWVLEQKPQLHPG